MESVPSSRKPFQLQPDESRANEQDENNIGAGKLFESERKQHNQLLSTYSPHRMMEGDHSKYLQLGMVSIGLL